MKPGQTIIAVDPASPDGDYNAEVIARRNADGSLSIEGVDTWRVMDLSEGVNLEADFVEFKARVAHEGGHVHVDVFTRTPRGPDEGTWAKCGTLIFRQGAEFDAFKIDTKDNWEFEECPLA